MCSLVCNKTKVAAQNSPEAKVQLDVRASRCGLSSAWGGDALNS